MFKLILAMAVLATFSTAFAGSASYQFCRNKVLVIDSEIQGTGSEVVSISDDELNGHSSVLVCSKVDLSYLKLIPTYEDVKISSDVCNQALKVMNKRKPRAVEITVTDGQVVAFEETGIRCPKYKTPRF